MAEKVILKDTLRDKRLKQASVTKTAPPAQGQESLQRYMGEEKYLIRKPKRRREGTGRFDD